MTDDAKTGNWRPGEKVPKTGTYKCLMCGPGGAVMHALNLATGLAGIEPAGLAASQPASTKFFREGELFTKCPNCAAIAADAGTTSDMTGWDFVSAEDVVSEQPASPEAPESTETDDRGHCDVCNESIVKSTPKIVTTEALQQATENGYCGKQNPLASAMGFDKKTAWAMTLGMGAATDWGLCPTCWEEVEPFLKRPSTTQPPVLSEIVCPTPKKKKGWLIVGAGVAAVATSFLFFAGSILTKVAQFDWSASAALRWAYPLALALGVLWLCAVVFACVWSCVRKGQGLGVAAVGSLIVGLSAIPILGMGWGSVHYEARFEHLEKEFLPLYEKAVRDARSEFRLVVDPELHGKKLVFASYYGETHSLSINAPGAGGEIYGIGKESIAARPEEADFLVVVERPIGPGTLRTVSHLSSKFVQSARSGTLVTAFHLSSKRVKSIRHVPSFDDEALRQHVQSDILD